MDDQEFHNAIRRLREGHSRVMRLIERMPTLTEEQKQEITEMLDHQKREYNEYLNDPAETNSRRDLAQAARRAAQQAMAEDDPKYRQRSQPKSWRNLWIALAIGGAILLLLKLWFH